MTNRKFKWVLTASFIGVCAIILLAGCQSEDEKAGLNLYMGDVELHANKIHIWWDRTFEAPLREYMSQYLNETFGREQFEYYEYDGTAPWDDYRPLSDPLLQKPAPDLIVFDSRLLSFFVESHYLEPIDIENFLVLKKEVLDELRVLSPDRQLYALPYGEDVPALFYNKTLFDQMEVPYPTDGMTWDEVFELTEQVKNPVSTSLDVKVYGQVASQLSLKLYNKETDRIDLETDAWLQWEQFLDEYQTARKGESYYISVTDFGNGIELGKHQFTGDKVAMMTGSLFSRTNIIGRLKQMQVFNIDWDVVSYPVFDSAEPVAPGRHMLLIGVPRMAENKEDAYKIIRYLLSEPVQFENMRRGLMSLREDAGSRLDEFGSALWSGKSTSFIDPEVPKGKYDPDIDHLLIDSFISASFRQDDLTVWNILVNQNWMIEKIMALRGERAKAIMEIQEKVKAYEEYNRQAKKGE